ncbi:hypothetical protein [Emticicia soli]|uniref:Uncharacterized protein n=1 Tax=Emticicia soli TaxID=2027878 RepID=A0ABW5J3L9_9BACT
MNSAKKIGTMLVCGLLFMRVMIAPIIYLQYEINKDYIIKNYCVNKNRPQLHCDGKCYLAKKLKAAEERDTHQSKVSAFKQLLELYHSFQNFYISQIATVISTLTFNFAYLSNYFLSPITSILKPPQF